MNRVSKEMLKAKVFLLTIVTLSHAAVFSPDVEKRINSFIETSMNCHHIPGMTLAVVKGDEVWSRGFGKEDLSSGKVVDSDSRFNIGSITKSFTATLLGILLSEKGMNWTAKVTDILGPTYGFIDPYRTKEMTIRDLLSHRTGLARLDFGGIGAGIPKSVSRSEFCKRMKYLPEELPFRDGFIYNNFMFMMAGHAAEVLGQDTWENLMTTKVLQPLGMNTTKFMLTPSDIFGHNTARPYVYEDDHFVNGTYDIYELHPIEPAGAIMSTATDMAKWVKFHLNLGKTESGIQLLKQDLVKDIHRVTTPMSMGRSSLIKPRFPADDIVKGYGYGLISSEYRGYRKIWHDGGLGAYISLMWTFPDMNIGMYASVNGPGFGPTPEDHLVVTFFHLTDYLIGLGTWLNESTACTFPEPWLKRPGLESKSETPISVGNIAELEGSYGNNLFPDVTVYSNATELHMNSNRLHGVLHPSSEKDRFLFELVSPIEYALIDNNNTHINFNVTFDRDSVTHTVNAVTLKMEVDLRYNKKLSPQIIG